MSTVCTRTNIRNALRVVTRHRPLRKWLRTVACDVQLRALAPGDLIERDGREMRVFQIRASTDSAWSISWEDAAPPQELISFSERRCGGCRDAAQVWLTDQLELHDGQWQGVAARWNFDDEDVDPACGVASPVFVFGRDTDTRRRVLFAGRAGDVVRRVVYVTADRSGSPRDVDSNQAPRTRRRIPTAPRTDFERIKQEWCASGVICPESAAPLSWLCTTTLFGSPRESAVAKGIVDTLSEMLYDDHAMLYQRADAFARQLDGVMGVTDDSMDSAVAFVRTFRAQPHHPCS